MFVRIKERAHGTLTSWKRQSFQVIVFRPSRVFDIKLGLKKVHKNKTNQTT